MCKKMTLPAERIKHVSGAIKMDTCAQLFNPQETLRRPNLSSLHENNLLACLWWKRGRRSPAPAHLCTRNWHKCAVIAPKPYTDFFLTPLVPMLRPSCDLSLKFMEFESRMWSKRTYLHSTSSDLEFWMLTCMVASSVETSTTSPHAIHGCTERALTTGTAKTHCQLPDTLKSPKSITLYMQWWM